MKTVNKCYFDSNLESSDCLVKFKGDVEWYLKGKFHKNDNLPAVMPVNESKEWYHNCISTTPIINE